MKQDKIKNNYLDNKLNNNLFMKKIKKIKIKKQINQ